MESIGVSYEALKKCRQRNADTYSIIDDPDDRRRILVEYDALKPSLKEKAQAWLDECPHDFYHKSQLLSYIQPDAAARKFFQNFRVNGNALADDDIASYYTAAQWMNMIEQVSDNKALLKKIGLTTPQFWSAISKLIQLHNVRIPSNYSRLTQKLKQYNGRNYAALIKTGNFETNNALKITDEAADWLVAMYALPNKPDINKVFTLYNIEAQKRGWKALKDSDTLFKFLHEPEIQQLWYGPRHGMLYAIEKYGYTLRTKLPTLRDALWYADATKLNFFDLEGKLKASYMVYEVMDVFSEVFLGYFIAKTENHDMQYKAFKSAFQFAGQKPYEIRVDNQGGHKKMEGFMKTLSHISIRTQAHNGKSKTIESAFGRFQQQFMKQLWFYTGQNITAKKLNSKANMEFVIANLKHLPTAEQVMAAYAACRNEWNNSPHHKYNSKTRLELYLNSHNPKAMRIDELDMVDIFWLTNSKPITYYTTGITIETNKCRYEYEVLTADGMPDEAFRSQHIGRKFIVKYDPDNMDHVRLYIDTPKGLQFVTVAEPRIVVPRAIQDHDEDSATRIKTLLGVRKSDTKRFKEKYNELQERTGIYAKDLLEQADSLGKYQKAMSLADADDFDETDFSPQQIMNMI